MLPIIARLVPNYLRSPPPHSLYSHTGCCSHLMSPDVLWTCDVLWCSGPLWQYNQHWPHSPRLSQDHLWRHGTKPALIISHFIYISNLKLKCRGLYRKCLFRFRFIFSIPNIVFSIQFSALFTLSTFSGVWCTSELWKLELNQDLCCVTIAQAEWNNNLYIPNT